MKIISHSEKETYNFAKKLAGKMRGGEVLCLIGDLGAGKTAFTKGIAAGLGISNTITSPTFVLMKVYEVKLKVESKKLKVNKFTHIDAYRLSAGDELLHIGAGDYLLDLSCITVIEWADRVKDIWPPNSIIINFKILKDNKREIKITQK